MVLMCGYKAQVSHERESGLSKCFYDVAQEDSTVLDSY